MARMLFVNLAVEDLDASVAFFTELGFTFDPRFTDESATCMVVNEGAYVMLLTRARFADFTDKEVIDPRTHVEGLFTISADSRQEVDELVHTALEAGGGPAKDPIDYGEAMYGWSFADPDGHHWEVMWMSPAAVEDPSLLGSPGA